MRKRSKGGKEIKHFEVRRGKRETEREKRGKVETLIGKGVNEEKYQQGK